MGFDKDKMVSIVRGAVVALLGGGTAGLLAYLGAVDWSSMGGPLAGALFSIAVNIIRKYLETPTTAVEPQKPVKPEKPNPFGG